MRLNIGSGPVVAAGWVNIDRDDLPGLDWQGDVLDGLPYADDTFDGAVAHHVLQMVAWPDLVPWLVEVRRVLRSGAWLRLSLPSLLGYIRAYQDKAPAYFKIDDRHETSLDGKLCMAVTQAGSSRSVFTNKWACELLARAGYDDPSWLLRPSVTRGPSWLRDLDSRADESLWIEGRA